MTVQNFFNYQFNNNYNNKDDYFVNSTNLNAYNLLTKNNFDQNIFLFGPKKSGKSHLLNIWKKNNKAVIFNNNFNKIINFKKNIAIDNVFINKSEEEIFHIINHCNTFNLKILITSSIDLLSYKYLLPDLISRSKNCLYAVIENPDDELLFAIILKNFSDRQIKIEKKIINFIISRIDRSYRKIDEFIYKIDELSLKKKKTN